VHYYRYRYDFASFHFCFDHFFFACLLHGISFGADNEFDVTVKRVFIVMTAQCLVFSKGIFDLPIEFIIRFAIIHRSSIHDGSH
jgi:hypothetical protein